MADQVFFKSGDRVYPMVARDEISLRDVITFPIDAEALLGRPFSWPQFEELAEQLDALPEDERENHLMAPFVLAVSVWTSRRAAGDSITFGECLDERFEWVERKVPKDRQPGKSKGPKRAPAKKYTRTSAQATAAPASDPTA